MNVVTVPVDVVVAGGVSGTVCAAAAVSYAGSAAGTTAAPHAAGSAARHAAGSAANHAAAESELRRCHRFRHLSGAQDLADLEPPDLELGSSGFGAPAPDDLVAPVDPGLARPEERHLVRRQRTAPGRAELAAAAAGPEGKRQKSCQPRGL